MHITAFNIALNHNIVYYYERQFYKSAAKAMLACQSNYLGMAVRVYQTPKGVNVARLNQRLASGGLENALRDCKELTSIQQKR